MRKLIAAINTTLDGVCDHTAGIADDEMHQHYTDLLGQGDTILYGRTTYQLMEFWRTLLEPISKYLLEIFLRLCPFCCVGFFTQTTSSMGFKSHLA